MSRIFRRAGVVSIAVSAFCSGCSGPPEEMALSIGPHSFEVEVAATPERMQRGLSHRDYLAENRGMLFIFPAAAKRCMWMRDTLLPLSVAFLDSEGWILNIATMQPNSLEMHCSEGAGEYALEMNAGWFAERGIRARSQVSGLP